ncbi:MAG TPA: GNAT family N-acetyltransferase [Pirellulales bacterium]
MTLEANCDADRFPLDLGICALRRYRWEDREDLIPQVNNRSVWRNMRDILPYPYTAADADAWLAKATGESPLLNCAITVSDKVVGGIGLTLQSDVFRRAAEIGYWLGESSWGRGIATAAVRAFTSYGFKHFDLQRIFAGVFAWNPASMRVLAKAGYWREGVMQHEVFKDGQIVDRVIYGITREAFLAEQTVRERASGPMAADVLIRTAQERDLEAINDIYNEAVLTTTATFDTQPKTLAERAEWFVHHGERHPVLVAESNGKIVGWASLSEYSPRKAYDHTAESSVYVKSEFRGQRIGRALQDALIVESRRLKFYTLIARVTAESAASMRLHESCGFRHVGCLKEVGRKFGRILDVHFLQLILD